MGYASSCWLKTTNIHTYPYIISIHIPETSTNSIKKLDDLNIGPIGLLNMTFSSAVESTPRILDRIAQMPTRLPTTYDGGDPGLAALRLIEGYIFFCVAHHVTWLPRWKMGWFSDPSLVIFMTPRVVNPIAIP